MRELIAAALHKLTSAQTRFLRLLRWHQDIDAPADLYESEPTIYWRSSQLGDGLDHYAVERPSDSNSGFRVVPTSSGIVWNELSEQNFKSLWDSMEIEPIAHELLREASQLYYEGSYRSALLMAATAVETAVKDHIGRLRPETHWILQSLPSPPIEKILRNYIPVMHASHSDIDNWKLLSSLWKACGELFTARNDTAHKGAVADAKAVQHHINTAKDILYVLDVLSGQSWARSRVSSQLRHSLNWPAPVELRGTVLFSANDWEIGRLLSS
ncbi:hypothetical protein [Nevskia sp.]|uniref:hypothetical protein n=1 Tax=Nevskia sp. TaxID=1929292 RepID=UPI0025F4F600|nr:hypothetical protein [Nevskia sp.]